MKCWKNLSHKRKEILARSKAIKDWGKVLTMKYHFQLIMNELLVNDR